MTMIFFTMSLAVLLLAAFTWGRGQHRQAAMLCGFGVLLAIAPLVIFFFLTGC
ncbi:hypothetical protein [Lacticaseibacillus mingshuiensis]|uniref:Uncharacterized protein n=1 Tax=Lacticaseibacillus mingshuiensis TaxID=2799574 RepID=A0ABW4CI01_9LACO|nr:hypothetical protein [Lacticaseibacillus mingshuiensis]